MIPGKRYTPDDVVRAGWRRRWWIVVPTVVATIVAVYLSLTAAPRFQAEALIQVVSPAVSNAVLAGGEEASLRSQERLQSIARQILTRPRLQQVIEDLKLYEGLRQTTVMEQVIERMRTDTLFDPVDQEIFKIGYTAGSPQLAYDVTQRVVALFLEESSRDREGLATATETFLESQLVDAKRRLEEQEQRLQKFQEHYSGELPSQQAANLQVLNSTQLQIQQLVEVLNRDRDQRLFLQRQLERARTEPASFGAGFGDATSNAPGMERGSPVQQLEAARAELRSMELRLTPEHPDIVQARTNIAKLERKADAEARATGLKGARTPADALKQSRLRDLESQIELVDRQIAARERELSQLRGSMTEYRRRIDAVPLHEAELTALTRDDEAVRKLYADLLDKKEKAKMAANLERKDVGERFKVMDPARLPEKRISPDRTMMSLMGLAAGLFLGIALAVFVEIRDSSMRSDDDVEASLGLPVLAMVPNVWAASAVGAIETRDAHLLRLAILMVGGAAVLSFAASLVWIWTQGR